MPIDTQKKMNALLNDLAKQHLGIQTLEYRRNGNLDYHEVGVCNIKAALEAAYRAGIGAAQS